MLNRRSFLSATAGFAVAGLASPLSASDLSGIKLAAMRGSINAGELGLRPAAFDDQSKAFAKMLDEAANRDMPVFLPPGVYIVSNLSLPRHFRNSGVPGATRVIDYPTARADSHVGLGSQQCVDELRRVFRRIGTVAINHHVNVGLDVGEHAPHDVTFALARFADDGRAVGPGLERGEVARIVIIDVN
jgi:hypothetical protein